MAMFYYGFEKLKELEFNSPYTMLHKNPTEKGLTFYGIYEEAYPNWSGWRVIKEVIDSSEDLKSASYTLSKDESLLNKVRQFYKSNFWDVAKLDKVKSQKIAEEIFCFGVNVGIFRSIKLAQELVGVYKDGKVGPITLQAINACDESVFDNMFDIMEQKYYNSLIEKNPKLAIYKDGWMNRAQSV